MPRLSRAPAALPRVAVVLSRLDGGGIERSYLHLLAELRDRGLSAELVLGQRTGPLVEHIPSGIPVFEVARRHACLFPTGFFRYLRRCQPTHVISAFDDVNCAVIAANELLGHPARVLASNHNTLTAVKASAAGLQGLKYRLLPRLMRVAYRKADAVVAVSSGVADDLAETLKLPRSSISVAYNPVITSDFLRRSREQPSAVAWSTETTPRIIFVGRFAAQKQVDVLIRAFALVVRRQPARLLLLGDGPRRQELETVVASLRLVNTIRFQGFLPNPLPAIRDSDLLVLPSAHEGLGNVLIEAMGCGTQVVSTDCPHGPAEILQHGRWGQLVPVGDVEELAQAILRSLNREFWIPPEALKRRASEFSVEAATDQYLDLLGLHARSNASKAANGSAKKGATH